MDIVKIHNITKVHYSNLQFDYINHIDYNSQIVVCCTSSTSTINPKKTAAKPMKRILLKMPTCNTHEWI